MMFVLSSYRVSGWSEVNSKVCGVNVFFEVVIDTGLPSIVEEIVGFMLYMNSGFEVEIEFNVICAVVSI
jgi:hypothetical protein